MLQQIGALNAAESLASLTAAAPWDRSGDAGDSARVRDLEQSLAAALARTGTAERELESAHRRIAELGAALARAGSRAGDDGRDALVAELAGAIREAAAAGDRWRPDYEDLMARTGHQRRWCEYVVRDARSAVFGSGGEAPADGAPESAREPAHAGSGADRLAHANGSSP